MSIEITTTMMTKQEAKEKHAQITPIPPATTHKLEYCKKDDRWRCACG